VIVTPGQDFAAFDVPRQIDEQIAGCQVVAQHGAEIVRRDPLLDESHALARPRLQKRGAILEVEHGDILQRHAEVFCEDRQRTLGHRTEPQHQYASVEFHHGF
jgi:hypothetical protein